MVEDAIDNGSFRNPWRDENRGHAHAKAIERKRHSGTSVIGGCRELVLRTRGRNNVIVNSSVLVIDDQQRGVRPQWRVLDRLVDGRDEDLTMLHIVVGMLIVRGFLTAIGFVIAVVRLDERIIGQVPLGAVIQKLRIGAKQFRLMLQQVGDLHGRTCSVVVVQLGGVLWESRR